MSTAIISSLQLIGKQTIIYGCILVFAAGILGGFLNILVFLSLRTFRQSSCALYLTSMSILNTIELLNEVLPRIILNIYNTDGTDTSLFYCKFKWYFSQVCSTCSLTCFCLVTIDQYCATCSHARLQQLCNIKLARRLVIIIICTWILHGIPYLVLFEHVASPVTGKATCTMTNTIYIQYRTYFLGFTLLGFLPVTITIVFGSMAYYNVQQLAHYTVPLVRRELEKQLTVMVLTQVFINVFALLPLLIANILVLNTKNSSDQVFAAQIQLLFNVTLIPFYFYYAGAFYIYICVSDRFRRQLIHVLKKVNLNRWERQPRMMINQVVPQP